MGWHGFWMFCIASIGFTWLDLNDHRIWPEQTRCDVSNLVPSLHSPNMPDEEE